METNKLVVNDVYGKIHQLNLDDYQEINLSFSPIYIKTVSIKSPYIIQIRSKENYYDLENIYIDKDEYLRIFLIFSDKTFPQV